MRQPIVFGNYLLLERISVGGMAEVFKAKLFGDVGFEKILAIKRILPSMAEDDQFITMFIDEAKIAGELAHPNIGQIYELGQIEGSHFIAMEYVWGKDVLQIQNRFRRLHQKMPLPMAGFIAAKVCDGLDYAHTKSDESGREMHIIHRDVSPQNMLVSFSGEVKIIDFGIAKARSRSSKTQAGVLKGKFGYMSPEQVRGQPLDQRSDIFSIGTLLYEMVTGERLFTGETDFETLEKVRHAVVPVPSRVNPAIPPELDQIILRALMPNPDERYHWASEMQEELTVFVMEQQPIFTSKRLAQTICQLFEAERAREQARLEEYRKIAKEDMHSFSRPKAGARREVVMSLLPLDSVATGNQPIVEVASEMVEAEDLSHPASDEDAADDDEMTQVGGPAFMQPEPEAPPAPRQGRSHVLTADAMMEVVEPQRHPEFEDDDETFVFQEELPAVAPQTEAPAPEAMPSEPTFIFNAQSGQIVQMAEQSTMIFSTTGPESQQPDSEMPSQGPTVIFDIGLGGTVGKQEPAHEAPALITGPGVVPPPVAAAEAAAPVAMATQPRVHRSSSLVKDILIGVLVAMVIILGIIIWRVVIIGGWRLDSPATLIITARPPRIAQVFVDGQLKGEMMAGAPFTLKEVAPQEHTVTLKPRGGTPLVRKVTLDPGDVKVLTLVYASGLAPALPPPVVARPKPVARTRPAAASRSVGYLVANTDPWGARVKVDGRNTGKSTPVAPRDKISLKPGAHKVTFVSGGKSYTFPFSITEGKITRVIKKLPAN